MKIFIFYVISFINVIGFMASRPSQTQPPHIIFILADDLGWHDVGFHGMKDVPTPNIDALAANSIVLNNYYVAPVCTPSRAALLTGYYPSHTGLHHSVPLPFQPYGLPLHFKTLPQKLNELGYRNHIVGKWHLGFHTTRHTPLARGFHSHYGFWPGHIDFFSHNTSMQIDPSLTSINPESPVYDGHAIRDNLIAAPIDDREGEYLTHVLNEKALNVIKRHDQRKPLFLFLSHHSVHRGNILTPITGPPGTNEQFAYIKDDDRRNFAGNLKSLDDSVGDILEALRETRMLSNSVVIFSSDNGAEVTSYTKSGGSNWPLRGEKRTPWEGSMRAVGTVWYPGLRNGTRISNQLMHMVDWMPTLYRVAGGNPENLGPIDGVDMWEALRGNLPSPRKNALLLMNPVFEAEAARVGDYKVVSGIMFDLDGWHSVSQFPNPNVGYLTGLKDENKAAKTMKGFYEENENEDGVIRKTNWAQFPIQVECSAIQKECFPKEKPCLFNIAEDPCEKNNLADQEPQILENIMSLLNFYRSTQVPIANKPLDPLANPDLHNGHWSPWLDYDQDAKNVVNQVNSTRSEFKAQRDYTILFMGDWNWFIVALQTSVITLLGYIAYNYYVSATELLTSY